MSFSRWIGYDDMGTYTGEAITLIIGVPIACVSSKTQMHWKYIWKIMFDYIAANRHKALKIKHARLL